MDTKSDVIEIIERGAKAETIELPAAKLLPILNHYLTQCAEVDAEVERLREKMSLAEKKDEQ